MKYIRLFEDNKNITEPQIGDYVICVDSTGDLRKRIFFLIE